MMVSRHPARLALVAAALLSFAATAATASAIIDGPYVRRTADGSLESLTVEEQGGTPVRRAVPLAPEAPLVIPAVGEFPSVTVKLRGPAEPAVAVLGSIGKAPLFVVADTHGEYIALARLLQAHGVIDATLRWSYGRGRLLVLGDVFDRGPNHLEILWLLYQLEAEAEKAGGGVHLLLGNHETMVMMGDLRYLHAKYVDTARVLGVRYYELFDAHSVLGQWLRSRAAVMKADRALFLHGGISPALVARKLTIPEINLTIRRTLDGRLDESERDLAGFLMTTEGPLWYRGYFAEARDFPTATPADVGAVLDHFDVDRIFVGHTIVPAVTPLYDGRVIALNVPAKAGATGSTFEALRIRGGQIRRATLDGKLQEISKGR